jgi:hypothetical protein
MNAVAIGGTVHAGDSPALPARHVLPSGPPTASAEPGVSQPDTPTTNCALGRLLRAVWSARSALFLVQRRKRWRPLPLDDPLLAPTHGEHLEGRCVRHAETLAGHARHSLEELGGVEVLPPQAVDVGLMRAQGGDTAL